jgi:hypothetical protein
MAMEGLERPQRPGDDATADEIAEWMDRSFGWALATAIDAGADDE